MRLRPLLSCALLLCACPVEEPPVGGDTDGPSFEDGPAPVEDEWEPLVDQPFDASAVQTLIVGGKETSDNFANRGDITVVYEDTDRIRVDIRRFTQALSQAEADGDFGRLSLWAYATSGNPSPPPDMDPADLCFDPSGDTAWQDGCQIRIYYDGLVQPSRTGADIRITLPQSFTGELSVTTEDNAADPDYHDRSEVCIESLAGSADVELGAGEAFVTLADDVTPFPLCSDAEVEACEAVGWIQGCDCLLTQGQASSLAIRSGDGQAANATVDVPESLWGRYNMVNMMDGQDPDDDSPGAHCKSTVDAGPGVMGDVGLDLENAPWVNTGLLNQPPAPALNGAGYGFSLTTDRCEVVTTTQSPDDFVGQGNGELQDTTERGNLSICAGCLDEGVCG